MRNKALLWVLVLLVACTGCGRKLPPLPPAAPDPVEVGSIRFEDGKVTAIVRCNVAGATVTLLGKPKGICPACTDDLLIKQQITLAAPQELALTDSAPEADYMVYRIASERGTSRWITPAQIVVRKH